MVTQIDERSAATIAGIEALAPRWILHLPSSTLKAVVGHFLERDGRDGFRIVPIPHEEEGIGILSGLALAGVPALMIIQDNGIGNLLTALNTFPLPYHIPLLVIVSRRGGLGEYNSMIHEFSERVEAILDAAGVRWFQLDARTPIEGWADTIIRAGEFARTTHRPIFVLVNLMGG
ncbi:MAG: thiamine pyrophosphate-binding protein [Chloroflexota bacterium]|nr:thiamine pyrophosphate-binding protein [Chloroflexota bacterium]